MSILSDRELFELEAENECECGFTETKPTACGWYWFLPNGKSPMLGVTATVRHVEESPIYKSDIQEENICVRFPHAIFLVSEMGGLWSERLEEPK